MPLALNLDLVNFSLSLCEEKKGYTMKYLWDKCKAYCYRWTKLKKIN